MNDPNNPESDQHQIWRNTARVILIIVGIISFMLLTYLLKKSYAKEKEIVDYNIHM